MAERLECPHCEGTGMMKLGPCDCDAEWNLHTCITQCYYCYGTGRMTSDEE